MEIVQSGHDNLVMEIVRSGHDNLAMEIVQSDPDNSATEIVLSDPGNSEMEIVRSGPGNSATEIVQTDRVVWEAEIAPMKIAQMAAGREDQRHALRVVILDLSIDKKSRQHSWYSGAVGGFCFQLLTF
ncbi:MAG: hypothetical protein ACRCUY_00145, partial [Thermoguttaceae bacterium]